MNVQNEINKKAKELWLQFGDTPINNKDEIELPFLHFPAGANRFDVWHWFEETFDLSVARDLQSPTSEIDREARRKQALDGMDNLIDPLLQSTKELIRVLKEEAEKK